MITPPSHQCEAEVVAAIPRSASVRAATVLCGTAIYLRNSSPDLSPHSSALSTLLRCHQSAVWPPCRSSSCVMKRAGELLISHTSTAAASHLIFCSARVTLVSRHYADDWLSAIPARTRSFVSDHWVRLQLQTAIGRTAAVKLTNYFRQNLPSHASSLVLITRPIPRGLVAALRSYERS